MAMLDSCVPIQKIHASSYIIPTDSVESDGTFVWDSTTLVLVEIEAGSKTGIGFSYADTATAKLIHDKFAHVLQGHNALAINECWAEVVANIRNLGRPGICSMAISAVDTALWDLKGKLLNAPLVTLLGAARKSIPVYGSGGFTSYPDQRLWEQFSDWAEAGISRVKMKVGRESEKDIQRVRVAREAIGNNVDLFVDANGAYQRKQALAFADAFVEFNVSWFEEPVSSDDLVGLRLLRDRGPAGMAISAGEYGYDLPYFRRMLQAQAVDILQADATRCAGITGFLGVAALCEAYGIPLSSHCAPTIHVHICCAARPVVHLEYFYDHARIEQMLFDGTAPPMKGALFPDLSRPGLGVEFKYKDAQCYRM